MDQSNDTLQSIEKRHSIRLFSDEPVPRPLLFTILEAANRAPSAHNQQSWHFIVIEGAMKKELGDLVSNSAARFPKSAAVFLRMAARSISSAPVVVAVANTGELIEHGGRLFGIDPEQAADFCRTMEIQSSAAAVENMLLAATSIGLATVWLGALYLIKDEVLTLLGEPKGEFMAVVPLGFPLRETRGPEKRPLDAIIKYLAD